LGQPLDPQKAYVYGQVVQAAYTMFNSPQGPDPLRPAPAGIPPEYELGAWIHMSDFFLNIVAPKFYGIVVHEVANPDSRIIAIRGTEHMIEWLDDGVAIPVPFHQVPSAGRVAYGFDRIYSTLKVVKRPLPAAPGRHATPAGAPDTFSGSFADQLDQEAASREVERGLAAPFAEGRTRPPRPTAVTGHSLGAALCTLFATENHAKRRFDIGTLCTFASPHVGDTQFAHLFNLLPMNSWRIVNKWDLVPKLPPSIPVLVHYSHVDTAYPFDSSGFAKNNPVCWHVLDTYLHWLNAASPVASECVP
jgi:Lipase (class 3)